MQIQAPFSLQDLNTLGVKATAPCAVTVTDTAALKEALLHFKNSKHSFVVLGGGSNIVLTKQKIAHAVIKMDIKGIDQVDETKEAFIIEAGAGVLWHDLVTWTIQKGYSGLENLALIPGTVGAAPVQNIGAYGVELKDRLHSLTAIETVSLESRLFDAKACQFAYRDSIFKQAWLSKGALPTYIITHVRLALPKKWKPVLTYAELQHKIKADQAISARDIYEVVIAIRKQKLPDPQVIGNVGSFFKNPEIDQIQLTRLIQQEPEVIYYDLGQGRFKVAAGWLIQACGWKGNVVDKAGVYEHQALVLVNKGDHEHPVTGQAIMQLAKAIQTTVKKRFGITLEIEPMVW